MAEKSGKPEVEAKDTQKLSAEDQLRDQRERTIKAKDEVQAAYDKEKRKIRTPMADFNESVIKGVLTTPLDKLEEEIDQSVKDIKDKKLSQEELARHNKGLEDFEKRRKEAKDFAISYIQAMAKDTGGIDAEVLAKMTGDINRRADRFVKLIISGKHKDIVQAFLAALGSQGDSSDMVEANKKAFATVEKYLNSEFDKPDSDIMPYLWSILSFMSKEDRVKIAKEFCKGRPDRLKAFLVEGNRMGVYNAVEIKELNPGQKYSDAEMTQFQTNWQAQNNFKAEASRLGVIPYGTENAAGKMITLGNALLTFIKFGAGVTIIGNFMTGAWQGGKFRGFNEAIKRLTNPQSLAAAGIYAAIKVGESSKTMDQFFHGDDVKKQAAKNLQKERDGNPKWKDWDNFFKQGDYAGAKVFFDFIQSTKQIYDTTDLSKMKNYLTPANFLGFLDRMASSKKEGKPDAKDVNYATLRDSFKKINPEEIMTFAKIFDTLNLGGATVNDEYTQYLNISNTRARGASA
ncbi:hypothetical protein HZA40_03110 [Candidatus Peregrinibacteria bacterium]|nr:hypothetical protein [Candidatus Peregrinibacteria bacterium]